MPAPGRPPLLDDLDRSIIKCLQLGGRRPCAQIGRELKVPEATVRQRAERLISRGVVHVVGVTDPLAMGFQQPAFIGLKVEAVCADNEHLLQLLTLDFAAIDGIRSTETLVELRFVKESYQWGSR